MAVTVFPTISYNLAIADLWDVKDELRRFNKKNWMHLGRELGVEEEHLEEVRATCNYGHSGLNEWLVEMLNYWLKRHYNEAKFGSPTWETLANAVERSNDAALADAIREHP